MNSTIVRNMQNAFQKPEIILAYTAHTGSRVSEKRKRMREGRLDLEWQQLVCLSVTAAASQHTEILCLFRNKHAVVACVQKCLCLCVCVHAHKTSVSLANHLLMPLSWGAADSVFTCCCYSANTRVYAWARELLTHSLMCVCFQ